MYKNSVAIIRTRKDTVVGCHMVATRKYIQIMPSQFDYKNAYICDSFELLENVGGDVIIVAKDSLRHANVRFKNRIRIRNVEEIEILTEHEV